MTYRFAETAGGGASTGRDDAPLVFTFHGTGGTSDQFHGFAAQVWPGAHVISPQGDVSEGGAARFFRRTGAGVYDMDDLARRTDAMAAFVADHKARLGPSRTIGLGYSNGANILATTLFARPDLFDAVVLMHPLIPWHPDLGRRLEGTRVLLTAGRNDAICPMQMTDALVETFRGAGADIHTHIHRGGHEIARSEIDAIGNFAT